MGVHCEGVKGGERRLCLFSCPLVASAEATPLLRKSTFPQKSNFLT